MTDETPWHFLLNPAAGRGKALRRWRAWLPALQAALPAMTVAESSADEGMAALAEAAVRSGKTHLVGVGGDGTHHDILNGIVRANGLASVVYAPLPLGTGNDWVRTLKTPKKVAPWLKMLHQQKTINHRVGKLVYVPFTPPTPPASSSFRVADTPRISPDGVPSRSDKRSPGAPLSPEDPSSLETPTPPASPSFRVADTPRIYPDGAPSRSDKRSPGSPLSPEDPRSLENPTQPTPPASPSFRVADTPRISPDGAPSRSDKRSPGSPLSPEDKCSPKTPQATYFLNVAGLAYDAEVVRRSENARWKNRWLYPVYTLLYLKDFTPPTVEITYNGNTVVGAVHTVNLGIGRYNGGGMRLVPQAKPTANTLALTYAKQLPIWKILLSSWRFYTGTIGALAEVTTTHAQTVSIKPVKGQTSLEADGELLGQVPVTASLLEQGFKVVV